MADVLLCGVTHPHAKAHLKTLLLSDSVSRIAAYDPDPSAVEQVCSENPGISAGYSDLDEAIGNITPSVAVACFPNQENEALSIALLEAGVHVISEKPIAATAEGVGRVLEAAEKTGRKLGVMYQNRFHPLSQEARRIVQSGEIGRITGVEARLITSQVRFRNPEHWLFKKEVSGGGILSWLGCHYLDLLRYVTGSEIVRVSGMVDTLSGEAIDVEDVATLSLKFEAGFLGSLQAGYQLALSKSGYIGPNYETYMTVRGTEGRVVWEPSGSEIKLLVESAQRQDAPSREITFSLPSVDAYGGAYGLAFLDQFIASTESDEVEVPAAGTDAYAVARVIEAAYTSSESGQHVEIG